MGGDVEENDEGVALDFFATTEIPYFGEVYHSTLITGVVAFFFAFCVLCAFARRCCAAPAEAVGKAKRAAEDDVDLEGGRCGNGGGSNGHGNPRTVKAAPTMNLRTAGQAKRKARQQKIREREKAEMGIKQKKPTAKPGRRHNPADPAAKGKESTAVADMFSNMGMLDPTTYKAPERAAAKTSSVGRAKFGAVGSR